MKAARNQSGVARIYAIDDSPDIRSLLLAMLGKEGHSVRLFESGKSGLEAALAYPPDLILCDIGMDGIDGFDVLAALRANPDTAEIPFIFLTGSDDRGSFRKALNQRADDYLVKPIQHSELVLAIEWCLGRSGCPAGGNGESSRAAEAVQPLQHMPTVRFERLFESMDATEVMPREIRYGAILYFDIRNFTTYAEYLSAEEVAEMLNVFYAKACDPIVQQGGWVVKMMGDAVLAMFDANRHGSESVLRALRAALLIVMAASKFREWMSARFGRKSLPQFAVGIGVHYGEAVVCGLAGDPEGSSTIIGDAVNVTARIEELSRRLGWSIVVSHDVVRLASERIEFGRSSTVALRGRDAPIEVMEVVGLSPPEESTVQNLAFYQALRCSISENSNLLSDPVEHEGIYAPNVEGYRLVRKLGRGGMSTVYLAEPVTGEPRCVIKLVEIGANDAQAEAIDRFIQEYALVSQIRHPNVAEIYAQGFTSAHAYIVMEYFANGDLCTAARQGLSMRKILQCVKDIAAALDAIHRVDIVHRDLKPANVMLRKNGTAVLADFGIAKHLVLNMTHTRMGQVFGTPHYVSPEQALGKTVDRRSDLYSLGVMFYELITGALPYQAQDSAQLLGMHVNAEIPRLQGPLVRYQPIVDGLMAKDPDHRFGNARELLQMLHFYIADSHAGERTRAVAEH